MGCQQAIALAHDQKKLITMGRGRRPALEIGHMQGEIKMFGGERAKEPGHLTFALCHTDLQRQPWGRHQRKGMAKVANQTDGAISRIWGGVDCAETGQPAAQAQGLPEATKGRRHIGQKTGQGRAQGITGRLGRLNRAKGGVRRVIGGFPEFKFKRIVFPWPRDSSQIDTKGRPQANVLTNALSITKDRHRIADPVKVEQNRFPLPCRWNRDFALVISGAVNRFGITLRFPTAGDLDHAPGCGCPQTKLPRTIEFKRWRKRVIADWHRF